MIINFVIIITYYPQYQLDRYTPILQVISEEHLLDNVTVTVEWTQQIGALYNVRVMPLVPIVLIGNVSRQLTLSYNMEYNFSVVAVTPCGNATSFITLNYGKVYIVQHIMLYMMHWRT